MKLVCVLGLDLFSQSILKCNNREMQDLCNDIWCNDIFFLMCILVCNCTMFLVQFVLLFFRSSKFVLGPISHFCGALHDIYCDFHREAVVKLFLSKKKKKYLSKSYCEINCRSHHFERASPMTGGFTYLRLQRPFIYGLIRRKKEWLGCRL